jgi:POT family proton-dependent oligopeptide transporter
MDTETNVPENSPNNLELNVIDQDIDLNEIEPTTEELNTLEHISDRIPLAAWLIVVCEFCERFAFYGITGPFQNYIQFPVPGPNDKQPGALGRGHQTATLLTTFFQFFCYITPIAGAIVADQFWGKYKAIFVACIIYLIGLLVLVLTSIPPSINAGSALPGLIIAMIILGIGTGGVKSNVSPLMAEQYTRKTPIVKGRRNSSKIQIITKNFLLEIKGKKKIIDPKM